MMGTMLFPTFDEPTTKAWRVFLTLADNHGHVQRMRHDEEIEAHVREGLASTRATIARVKVDLPDIKPCRIVEIGSSAGLNCFALKEVFPEAEVIGFEPEKEAVAAAGALAAIWPGPVPVFIQGVGEALSLEEGSVDLILCHTVIEHVSDVPQVIAEIARVLSPNGVVHFEAPNYIWPFEPHLGIVTLPWAGKRFMAWCARLQGKSQWISFLGHLQLVTAPQLEHLFRREGLSFHNRTEDKLRAALTGTADIKKYKGFVKVVRLMNQLGLGALVVRLVMALRFYPSVLYTLWRTEGARRGKHKE